MPARTLGRVSRHRVFVIWSPLTQALLDSQAELRCLSISSMSGNTARIQVGRLLEIRAAAGYRTTQDVDVFFEGIEREVAKLPPGSKHVTVVDWRRCPVMAPEAVERIAVRIAGANERTERSAALASKDSATAVLQFLRVIRDAKLPDRKLFFDEGALIEWLGEVLTEAEKRRLERFLAEVAGA